MCNPLKIIGSALGLIPSTPKAPEIKAPAAPVSPIKEDTGAEVILGGEDMPNAAKKTQDDKKKVAGSGLRIGTGNSGLRIV